jgi:hypothetical protein
VQHPLLGLRIANETEDRPRGKIQLIHASIRLDSANHAVDSEYQVFFAQHVSFSIFSMMDWRGCAFGLHPQMITFYGTQYGKDSEETGFLECLWKGLLFIQSIPHPLSSDTK